MALGVAYSFLQVLLAQEQLRNSRQRRKVKAPPIPEYLLVKKHSVVSYHCPSEFFSDHRLMPGGTYVLRGHYEELSRPKRDAISTFLTETAVPKTRLTACN